MLQCRASSDQGNVRRAAAFLNVLFNCSQCFECMHNRLIQKCIGQRGHRMDKSFIGTILPPASEEAPLVRPSGYYGIIRRTRLANLVSRGSSSRDLDGGSYHTTVGVRIRRGNITRSTRTPHVHREPCAHPVRGASRRLQLQTLLSMT